MRTLILTFLIILTGCSPSNYEDCILDGMKGVDNNIAAIAVRQACQAKFKEPIPVISEPITIRQSLFSGAAGKDIGNIDIEITGDSSVKVTNRSNVNFYSITLGATNLDVCSVNKDSYSDLINCKGDINSNETNYIGCTTRIPDSQYLCVVEGFYKAYPKI